MIGELNLSKNKLDGPIMVTLISMVYTSNLSHNLIMSLVSLNFHSLNSMLAFHFYLL